MALFTDQTGYVVELSQPPKRIISLVPSQTELLYTLGLTDEVVGITKFCIYPAEWFKSKTRIGGTKTVDIKKVLSLQPDLIIANKEENVEQQVLECTQAAPVWVSDINNLQEALQMIVSVGEMVNRTETAKDLAATIQNAFDNLRLQQNEYSVIRSAEPDLSKISAAYLIWRNPYMAAGGDTFINNMLWHAGFSNAFEQRPRYPIVTIEEIAKTPCKVLLLSSEPYPFKQQHINELQAHLPHTRIVLVDGEMFSWYGSRLQKAPAYFKALSEGLKD